jgi:Ca2+-binding EF-hand superfamily protein
MTRLVGFLSLLLAAGFLLAPATAGDDGGKVKDADAIFHKLDTNKDGKLTRDEFLRIADRFGDKEKARKRLGVAFDKLDPDNKGLTKDQFRTILEASQKKKQEETGKSQPK